MNPSLFLQLWLEIIRAKSSDLVQASPTLLPIVAEAYAILWAMHLANHEQWSHVHFEGDAKSCFDSFSAEDVPPDWSISNIISSILSFKIFFMSVCFCCVNRECNVAAHAAAKHSLASKMSLL